MFRAVIFFSHVRTCSFISDREYVLARRLFREGSTLYGITKVRRHEVVVVVMGGSKNFKGKQCALRYNCTTH